MRIGFYKEIGDETLTLFCKDNWAGSTSLKNLFTRLYTLCTNKFVRVSEMGEWREGRWSWVWQWRRAIFEREHPLLNTLIDVVNRYLLKHGEGDKWRWSTAANGIYSTREAYSRIAKLTMGEDLEVKTEFKLL